MPKKTEADMEYGRMMRPFWIHVIWFFTVVAIALVGSYFYPWHFEASYVADSSRTLLQLNGTLLALVVGFSSFYFSVLDSRRQSAIEHAAETQYSSISQSTITSLVRSAVSSPNMPTAEKIMQEVENSHNIFVKTMASLVAICRASMRAISNLLIAISFSYGFFIAASYWVYIYVLPMTASQTIPAGLANYAFSLSVFSPAVTVADAAIMTYFLTRYVAGSRSGKELLNIMGSSAEAPDSTGLVSPDE